jgi:hypothetical protein
VQYSLKIFSGYAADDESAAFVLYIKNPFCVSRREKDVLKAGRL